MSLGPGGARASRFNRFGPATPVTSGYSPVKRQPQLQPANQPAIIPQAPTSLTLIVHLVQHTCHRHRARRRQITNKCHLRKNSELLYKSLAQRECLAIRLWCPWAHFCSIWPVAAAVTRQLNGFACWSPRASKPTKTTKLASYSCRNWPTLWFCLVRPPRRPNRPGRGRSWLELAILKTIRIAFGALGLTFGALGLQLQLP